MLGVIKHCYEVGLRIYHTNSRCCTDLWLWFRFFNSSLHTWATRFITAPHARNTVAVHDFIWSLYV